MTQCEDGQHNFVFLRPIRRNVGFERNPTWKYYDLFFCSKCLAESTVELDRGAEQALPKDHKWTRLLRDSDDYPKSW